MIAASLIIVSFLSFTVWAMLRVASITDLQEEKIFEEYNK